MSLSRRSLLSLSGASLLAWQLPKSHALAQATPPRHLVIIRAKGAIDGYGIMQPIGVEGRPSYHFKDESTYGGAHPIGDAWLLNPAASALAPMWLNSELSFVTSIGIRNATSLQMAEDLMRFGSEQLQQRASPWSERFNQVGEIIGRDIQPGKRSNPMALFDQIPGLYEKLSLIYASYGLDQIYNKQDIVRPEDAMLAEMGIFANLAEELSTASSHTVSLITLPGLDQAEHIFTKPSSDRQASTIAHLFAYLKSSSSTLWQDTAILFLPDYGLAAEQVNGARSRLAPASLGILAGGAINGGQFFDGGSNFESPALDNRQIIATALTSLMGLPIKTVFGDIFTGFPPEEMPFPLF